MDILDKTFFVALLKEFNDIMAQNKEYLINIDSVVGDGDLGLTMSDGFAAAFAAANIFDGNDIGKMLYTAGKEMSVAVPSTMGTLMASGFMYAGKELKGEQSVSNKTVVDFFNAFLIGVMNRGKAKPGEKTFVDPMSAAVNAMQKELTDGGNLKKIVTEARRASQEEFDKTTQLLAVHGRAAIRGENSKGVEDAGAAVACLMIKAFEQCNNKL